MIPNSLFEGCGKLETLKTKAKAITVIGDRAFKNCQALAKFDLKKGLTEIGEEAFRSTAITKAQIPDTVTKIGKEAFRNTQLTSISFPKEMEEIPEGVCYYAAALKDIKLPAAVKKIGKLAFAYTDPTNLNLPEGLVEIGEGAFEEIGYRVFTQVLNSKNFGVPQNRERIYIVCFRNDIAPEERRPGQS